MHLYNESTSRRQNLRVRINWSRQLTFSSRQTNYILDRVPNERGIYCIYAMDYSFPHSSSEGPMTRWSPIIYIGSGWLNQRLCAHLKLGRNRILKEFLLNYQLGYRFDRIFDDDEEYDWPAVVEAGLLNLFKGRFGFLPKANRREESIPPLPLHRLFLHESDNFSILKRRC
jgi:hypothetical protein